MTDSPANQAQRDGIRVEVRHAGDLRKRDTKQVEKETQKVKKVVRPKMPRLERPGSIFNPKKEKRVKVITKSTGKMLDDPECLSSETQDDRSEEAAQKSNLKEASKDGVKGVETKIIAKHKPKDTENVKHFLVNRIAPIKPKASQKSLAQIELESEVKSIQNQLIC